MRLKKETDLLLSVCMVTYNHERWISQALDGVLMQRTSFPFELVIGEDCSTDKTREIISSYSAKNIGIIKPYFNQENLGLSENFSRMLNKCKGTYIAICEGDDFWTDPYKLQKQVDFLEANPELIMSSHNSGRLDESTFQTDQTLKYSKYFIYDQKRFLEEWVTQPLTCVFRNIFRDYTIFNKEYDMFCDVILFYELLKHGDGYFLPDNMATFRVHKNALSSGLSKQQWLINHVIMFDYLYKHNRRDKDLQKISRNYCLSLYIDNLKNSHSSKNDFKSLNEYFKRTDGWLEIIFTFIIRVPFYILKYGVLSKVKSTLNHGQ